MNPFIELCAENAKRTYANQNRSTRSAIVPPIKKLRIGKGGKLEVVD